MESAGVFVEEKGGRVTPSVLGVLSYLKDKGVTVVAFVFADKNNAFTEQLGNAGANKIVEIFPGDSLPEAFNPQIRALKLLNAMEETGVNLLFGISSPQGRDMLPRAAAICDAPLVMDCTEVDLDHFVVKTSRYSGKTEALIKVKGEKLFFGMRPNFHGARENRCTPEVIEYRGSADHDTGIEFLERIQSDKKEVDLTEAEIIISGGRGMKNGDNFIELFECAEKMNAAVGASRVAVDEGWAPYTMQVGQTGVKVNPKVYIACGISGSVQHFAGMKTSGIIIAINLDENSPIVSKCDYYVIGDLFDIIPALTERLQ